MDLPSRHILIGMTLGAICATALAVTGPGMVIETFADELLQGPVAPGFDTSKLVKFEGRNYQIQTEDWVSQDPISSQVVKKVEAGRVTYVTIATTSTGTYSSDAMFSSNVQYPGIAVDEVLPARNHFWSWRNGNRFSFNSRTGHSFLNIGIPGAPLTTCVSGTGFRVC